MKGEKAYRKNLKGEIIDKILETGGNRILRYFPAKWTELGNKFGVSGKTAKNVWQKFVHNGTVSPKKENLGDCTEIKYPRSSADRNDIVQKKTKNNFNYMEILQVVFQPALLTAQSEHL